MNLENIILSHKQSYQDKFYSFYWQFLLKISKNMFPIISKLWSVIFDLKKEGFGSNPVCVFSKFWQLEI